MLQWLSQNAGTVVVAAVLATCVAVAVVAAIRSRRRGCSCGCANCPSSCKKKK